MEEGGLRRALSEAGLGDVVSCIVFVQYGKPMVSVKNGSATEGGGNEGGGDMIVTI